MSIVGYVYIIWNKQLGHILNLKDNCPINYIKKQSQKIDLH